MIGHVARAGDRRSSGRQFLPCPGRSRRSTSATSPRKCRLRPRRRRTGSPAAPVEPGRLDPGRLDPDRGPRARHARTRPRRCRRRRCRTSRSARSRSAASRRTAATRRGRARSSRAARRGVYTIVVRGYNGSFSDEPFVLRVKRTPPPTLPPCPARTISLGAPGTLPRRSRGGPADASSSSTAAGWPLSTARRRRRTMLTAAERACSNRPEIRAPCSRSTGTRPCAPPTTAWDASPCARRGGERRRARDQRPSWPAYRAIAARPALRRHARHGRRAADGARPRPRHDLARARLRRRPPVHDAEPDAAATRCTPRPRSATSSPTAPTARSRASNGSAASSSCRRCPSAASSRRPADIQAQLEQYVPVERAAHARHRADDRLRLPHRRRERPSSPASTSSWAPATPPVCSATGRAPTSSARSRARRRRADIGSVNAHYNQWQLEPAVRRDGRGPRVDHGRAGAGRRPRVPQPAPVHDGLSRRLERPQHAARGDGVAAAGARLGRDAGRGSRPPSTSPTPASATATRSRTRSPSG